MIAALRTDKPLGFDLRRARIDETATLIALIARSAAALGAGYYTPVQIDAAIRHVFGVDTALVADGTYFVVEADGVAIGCGGWSRRRTLFGGDAFAARDDAFLDPAEDAARIRAFFVDPAHARRGVADALLATSEAAAAGAGFTRLALMATLSGVAFYTARGFMPGDPYSYRAGDVDVPFVPMTKNLPVMPGSSGSQRQR